MCVSSSRYSSLVSVSYESPVLLERHSPSAQCVRELPEYYLQRQAARAALWPPPVSSSTAMCPPLSQARCCNYSPHFSKFAKWNRRMPSGAVLFLLRVISDKNVGVPTVHVSVAYRGGVRGVQIPPPRNSEGPPKSCQTPPDLWKLLKIAEFRTPTPQDVQKKGNKILTLPRFAIVLH